MFWLFKRKQVDLDKIKDYKQALKAIKIFWILGEWQNAYNSINEIRRKEEEAYRKVINEIDIVSTANNDLDSPESIDNKAANTPKVVMSYKEKEKLTSNYDTKLKELKEIEDELKEKEIKAKQKYEAKRFAIRIKNLEKDIEYLLKTNKTPEAMLILTDFLEANKENSKAIIFYNKKRAVIMKNAERNKLQEEKNLKQNTKLEAMKLIWETIELKQEENNENNTWHPKTFFESIKDKFKFYQNLQEKLKRKKLVDEVTLLVEEEWWQNLEIAKQKLERIHKWLTKELSGYNSLWYDFFWKILWADKIAGDTFWFNEGKEKYNFFLWDATWHWVKAWFIVTLFSMAFRKYAEEEIKEMTFNINNDLKQNLKSRNFITGILFEIQKNNLDKIDFAWMWHEPIFIYRAKTNTIESLVAWWLAWWIRLIREVSDVKIKSITLDDWDIIMVYSDWAIEEKNIEWTFYWIERLKSAFLKIATIDKNIKNIYDYVLKDLKDFKLWTNFVDDTTILLIKRDKNRDIVKKGDEYLKNLEWVEGITKKEIKNFEWKSKNQINEEIEQYKNKKEMKNILLSLDNLYYTWEILKLKQEAIRYIKSWFVDKKINYYLKKAINNESKYRISQKQQKIENKYNVLNQLLKKWDFNTVIKECEDVIIKDGNI